MIWKCNRRSLDLTRHARVMGILNVTPDSFSDGGLHWTLDAAMRHARRMIAEGAEIIDVGGESTRPGAVPVDADEEAARVFPVIRALRDEWSGIISIDTSKAVVALAALNAGADVINDISGLRADPGMLSLCSAAACGVVVMHMQGTPATMQQNPRYLDVVDEVSNFFHDRMHVLTDAGLAPEAICFDPGIGFGKAHAHNLELLRRIGSLAPAGRPLLLGASRKSFIGRILGNDDLAVRHWPSLAVTARARLSGVMLHRVHDVKANAQVLRMVEAIAGGRGADDSANSNSSDPKMSLA
ncbi:MAG: dihydropteroate synthase [Luteolibacter sp.]